MLVYTDSSGYDTIVWEIETYDLYTQQNFVDTFYQTTTGGVERIRIDTIMVAGEEVDFIFRISRLGADIHDTYFKTATPISLRLAYMSKYPGIRDYWYDWWD
jgi:hypothetical protein